MKLAARQAGPGRIVTKEEGGDTTGIDGGTAVDAGTGVVDEGAVVAVLDGATDGCTFVLRRLHV
ncbi:MAG: hypothetical protein ACRD6W_01590 [Nitrososphaerales archaeon]